MQLDELDRLPRLEERAEAAVLPRLELQAVQGCRHAWLQRARHAQLVGLPAAHAQVARACGLLPAVALVHPPRTATARQHAGRPARHAEQDGAVLHGLAHLHLACGQRGDVDQHGLQAGEDVREARRLNSHGADPLAHLQDVRLQQPAQLVCPDLGALRVRPVDRGALKAAREQRDLVCNR